jgi:endonuclease III
MGLEEIGGVLDSCPRLPRYRRDAARTVKEIAQLVVREGRGDARNLWAGRRALEVHRLLMRVHGVGEGIASMVLALLDRIFHVPLDGFDRKAMDVKADVHVVRVLIRLGVLESQTVNPRQPQASEGQSKAKSLKHAVALTRLMHPEYPALLDAPLWVIGRTWCRASAPRCGECQMTAVCAKRLD